VTDYKDRGVGLLCLFSARRRGGCRMSIQRRIHLSSVSQPA